MRNKNAFLFIGACAFFSLILCLTVFFLAYTQKTAVSISLLVLLFFSNFALSFLFFSFFYQKFIFSEIKKALKSVRSLYAHDEDEFEKSVAAISDSIDRLHAEVSYILSHREKEIEQVQKLENYRKEFLGNVSHELKTPIFNIQGYLATLIDGGINDTKINIEYLKRADKSVDRMIHIIDDLETISQLETGALSLEIEKINLIEIAQDSCKQTEIQAQKKNISLKIISKKDTLKVWADKHRIKQVFSNLLTNSIKYGKENGETLIVFTSEETKINISISDNGIGISPQYVPRVFERFFRVDKGRSREQGGTGLGLSIVKHIIEAHQQSIEVTSTENEGTTFTFSLPKA